MQNIVSTYLAGVLLLKSFRTFCLSGLGVKDTVWSLGDTLQELLNVV
jgi:hypothetical protein